MTEIRLAAGVWRLHESRPLGSPGGFGAVFLGESEAGEPVAIKRLHVTAGAAAFRELSIAEELQSHPSDYVVPVLDAGQDAESERYYIVMPVADESLQDYVAREAPLTDERSAAILSDIATGLAHIPQIVHRDLKPGNVLRFGDRWQVADFGIARFVEATTSSETLKEALTPAYAAPEQWRLERASGATDVYALGCIACVMLTATPPFVGTIEEVREGHLSQSPDLKLVDRDPALRTLVTMMLRKTPAARPSLDRVRQVLGRVAAGAGQEPRGGLQRLAQAAAKHEEQSSRAVAAASREEDARALRAELAREARNILDGCFEELVSQITQAVPNARVSTNRGGRKVHVAGATLALELPDVLTVIPPDAFPRSKWDVICGAAISVTDSRGRSRSASLWYTMQKVLNNEPRWYEVGYRGNPISSQRFQHEPTAVTPDLADRAHSPAMDVITTAYNPTPVDDEDVGAFCTRWIHILTAATEDRLDRLPGSLPTLDD
jgi:eukaryotic-like serine/threonine-protein kinase